MIKRGNGWLSHDLGLDLPVTRYQARVHPRFGLLAEHGPDVPPVFFLKFRYPVQTAASYGIADPQAVSSPVITWISRN